MSSTDIQNEMLEMVHRGIMEAVSPRIRKAGIFSIIADETMDATIQEQMSIVISFFEIEELEVCEEFQGFHNVVNTEANTFLNTIKDVLHQCDFPLAQARGRGGKHERSREWSPGGAVERKSSLLICVLYWT